MENADTIQNNNLLVCVHWAIARWQKWIFHRLEMDDEKGECDTLISKCPRGFIIIFFFFNKGQEGGVGNPG